MAIRGSSMSSHPHFCACCSVLTWEAVPCPELEAHTCKECAVLLLDAEVRLQHAGIEGCAKEMTK
jgi:hypothetical protein